MFCEGQIGGPVWKFQLSLIRPSGPGPSFRVTKQLLRWEGAIHRNPLWKVTRAQNGGKRGQEFPGRNYWFPYSEWARLGWCHYIQKPLHTVQWAAFRTEMTLSMSKGPAAQLRAVRRQLCEDTVQQKELLPIEGEIAPLAGPNQSTPFTLHLLFIQSTERHHCSFNSDC